MDGSQTSLRRRLTLPLLVLYGVGVTIGAGIYVLIGAMAGHAGTRAPLAFVLAGVVMGLTAASYAELCTRFPVSAGEAAYVKAAFRSRSLSTMTGLLTIVIGVISSAAVAIGKVTAAIAAALRILMARERTPARAGRSRSVSGPARRRP